jgi:hypothetical protein
MSYQCLLYLNKIKAAENTSTYGEGCMSEKKILELALFLLVFSCSAILPAEPIKISTQTQGLKEKANVSLQSGKRSISFRINLEKKSLVEILIFNSAGKKVDVLKQIMPAGPGVVVWDCSAFPAGTFQARLKLDGQLKKTKISLVNK